MKPQTADYLVAADKALSDAKRILAIDIPDQAARLVYYAAFHAAQALIFEHGDKASKTHKGVKSQFARLAKSDPRIDQSLPTFLARAYQMKTTADYESGKGKSITAADARTAIATAEHFVAVLEQVLSSPPTHAAP